MHGIDQHTAPIAGRKDRLIGRLQGPIDGPLFVVTAAVHGNEPAGIEACRRVLSALTQLKDRFRGDFVALIGNVAALEKEQRFVDRDLNRGWTDQAIEGLRKGQTATQEDAEQLALLEALEDERARARGDAYFIDLHTSSADGCPFVTCGDTLRNRRFALNLPLPILLGIEEQLDGSLLEYMSDHGYITAGVEGGQHLKGTSVDHQEAAIWLSLAASGNLMPEDVPHIAQYRRVLREARRGVPHVMEVRHRHGIDKKDEFQMQPGFQNFQPIHAGALLATDKNGEIRAEEDGLILLPLYQGLGDDGFFTGRKVSPAWLRLSALLRRMRLGRMLHWLPGVKRSKTCAQSLVVDTSVARAFPLEFFHLLGFRKLRRNGDVLLVTRRRFDIA